MLRLVAASLASSFPKHAGAKYISSTLLQCSSKGTGTHHFSTLVSGRTFESWIECVQDLRSRQLITNDAVAAVMQQLDRASFVSQFVSFTGTEKAYAVSYPD
jgi:hypothetical protein